MQPVTEGGTACATGAAAGSTSSSSGGSCSSSNGASGISGRTTVAFREAHVRLALHPEVDQRRRQTKNTIRIDLTGGGGGGGVGGQTVANRHPIDEHFKFPVSHDHLDHKTLRFQVPLNPPTLTPTPTPLSFVYFVKRGISLLLLCQCHLSSGLFVV